jgi:Pvc16 N-terminal domain
MLEELDGSLRNFLRADVPLRADDVDIEFSTPDKDWSARLSRSTVNLFMFDVRRSTSRAITGRSVRADERGYRELYRTPMVKVRYLLTVWTAEAADEHRVLGDVLRLLAVSGEIPVAHLAGDLGELGHPVELGLATEDSARTSDIWSPLGVTPRANLELIATLPASRPVERVVGPPPTEIDASVIAPPRPSEPRLASRRRRALVEERPGGSST